MTSSCLDQYRIACLFDLLFDDALQVCGRVGRGLDELAIVALVDLEDCLPCAAVGLTISGVNEGGIRTKFENGVADGAVGPCLAHVAALDLVPCALSLYSGGVESAIGYNKLVDAAVNVFDKIGMAIGIKLDRNVINDRAPLALAWSIR